MTSKWNEIKLGEIADFRNGLNFTKESFGKGVKVIGVKDFQDYSIPLYDEIEEINPEGVIRASDLLQVGDILFVRSNGNRELIGRSLFIDKVDEPISHSAFTIRVRFTSPDADPKYYSFLLRSRLIRDTLSAQGGGTNISNLNQQILNNLTVPLPPLAVQRKIADVLSAYDDLIEVNTRRIRILEHMAHSVYREWFGKVDAQSLPEGWQLTSLDKVSKNYDSKRVPLSSMKRSEMQGQYPYYGAAKVLDHVNDFIFDGKYLLIAEDGSVITTDGKPVLQMAFGKFWVNNHTHVLQGAGYISTEYLYLVLSQVSISGYITGAAQPKITQANLNRIPVVLPPKDLMMKFNKVFEDTFDLIETLNRKNANLRRTRDLLLPRLVSGEVELHVEQ